MAEKPAPTKILANLGSVEGSFLEIPLSIAFVIGTPKAQAILLNVHDA